MIYCLGERCDSTHPNAEGAQIRADQSMYLVKTSQIYIMGMFSNENHQQFQKKNCADAQGALCGPVFRVLPLKTSQNQAFILSYMLLYIYIYIASLTLYMVNMLKLHLFNIFLPIA